jgi:hypothetical protein
MFCYSGVTAIIYYISANLKNNIPVPQNNEHSVQIHETNKISKISRLCLYKEEHIWLRGDGLN